MTVLQVAPSLAGQAWWLPNLFQASLHIFLFPVPDTLSGVTRLSPACNYLFVHCPALDLILGLTSAGSVTPAVRSSARSDDGT